MERNLEVSVAMVGKDLIAVVVKEKETGDHVSKFFPNTANVPQKFMNWIGEEIWSWVNIMREEKT